MIPDRPDSGADPAAARTGYSRYTWRYLDDGAAAALWDELIDWVWWLRDRYELGDRIAVCWFHHGPVVEELTAAMAAWDESYRSGLALAEWHAKTLWPLVDRIGSMADFAACAERGCTHESGLMHAPEGTRDLMIHHAGDRDEDTDGDIVDAVVVGVITEPDMLSAVVAGEAVALDPGRTRGRYRFEDRLWTWSPLLGGYTPSGDYRPSTRPLRSVEN